MARLRLAGAEPPGVLVITPGLGLIDPDRVVTLADLRAIAAVGVAVMSLGIALRSNRMPLYSPHRSRGDDRVVLLGSIATGKYVE
jgi:hypothetical protein